MQLLAGLFVLPIAAVISRHIPCERRSDSVGDWEVLCILAHLEQSALELTEIILVYTGQSLEYSGRSERGIPPC